jgi:hexosaminidase
LKDEDALQMHFTHHVAKYLESKGRRLQGWNEIMKGGDLPKSTIIHQWNDKNAGMVGAKSGRDVVYSLMASMYFDHPWEEIPMAKVYATEPVPSELSPEEAKHILGLQPNLWTEHKPTEEICDDFMWPRLSASAEVGWSDARQRDYGDFMKRMQQAHYQRLAQSGLGASGKKSTHELVKQLTRRGETVEAKRK